MPFHIKKNHLIAFISFYCLLFFLSPVAADEYARKITKSSPQPVPPVLQEQPQHQMATPHTFGQPLLEIEELQANLYSNNTVLVVEGKIINKGHGPAQGYLIVNLLDKDDNVITAYETEINRGRPFDYGKSKPFQAQFDVSGINNMTNVSIEFVTP